MKPTTVGFNNFKPFGETVQKFSKKPITLVYGPNSMGKSSFIHMMLYMSYLQRTGDPGLISTDLFGDNLNIGGFEKFIHKRDKSNSLKLHFEYGDCSEEIIKFLELREIDALSSIKLEDLNHWLGGRTEVLEKKLENNFYYVTEDDKEASRRTMDIYEDGPSSEEESDFMVGNLSDTPVSGFYKDRYNDCLTTLSENYIAVEEYFYDGSEGNRVSSEIESEYINDLPKSTIAMIEAKKKRIKFNDIAKNIISRIEKEKEYVKELKREKPNLKINIEIKYSTKLKQVYIQKIEYLIQDELYDVIECEVIGKKFDTFFFCSGASLFCDPREERIEFGCPEILGRAPYYCRRRIFPGSNMTDRQPYLPPEYLNYVHTHRVARDTIDLKQLSFNEGFVGLIGVFNDVTQSKETQYIGPLRFYPERESSLNKSLLRLGDKPDSRNSWSLLKKDVHLRNEVNRWLSDPEKFVTPYKIKYKKFYDINSLLNKLTPEVLSTIRKEKEDRSHFIEKNSLTSDTHLSEIHDDIVTKVAGSIAAKEGKSKVSNSHYVNARNWIDNVIEFSGLSEQEKFGEIFEETEISGEIEYKEELVFEDLRNNTQISNRDLGLGVSQILPILIAVNRESNTTIVIEQPELHLHPTVQCDLADEFIRTHKEHNNECIIETHSEHILLRLQKRIREGVISHKDVEVLYIDEDEFKKGSEIISIELDQEGNILTEWPNGFFEESFDEMFG